MLQWPADEPNPNKATHPHAVTAGYFEIDQTLTTMPSLSATQLEPPYKRHCVIIKLFFHTSTTLWIHVPDHAISEFTL